MVDLGKFNYKCIFFTIGFSILGVLISLVLLFFNIPEKTMSFIAELVGIIGTISSIILSIMAMVYSNRASKDAENSLKEITNLYKTLEQEITNHVNEQGFGFAGIKTITNELHNK